MDLMKKAILEAVATSKGYLIDGLPRELGQAKIFEEEVIFYNHNHSQKFYGFQLDWTVTFHVFGCRSQLAPLS